MSLMLYHSHGACSRVVLAALYEMDLPHQLQIVNLYAGQQKTTTFRLINPKAKVPVLKDGRVVLTETAAILFYLSRKFPERTLLPEVSCLTALSGVMADLSWFSSGVHPIITRLRMPLNFADDPADVWRKAEVSMAAVFELLEARLSEGGWFYGAEFSALDLYLNWAAYRAEGAGFDLSPYPAIIRHKGCVEGRPSVQRMIDRDDDVGRVLAEAGFPFRPQFEAKSAFDRD